MAGFNFSVFSHALGVDTDNRLKIDSPRSNQMALMASVRLVMHDCNLCGHCETIRGQ